MARRKLRRDELILRGDVLFETARRQAEKKIAAATAQAALDKQLGNSRLSIVKGEIVEETFASALTGLLSAFDRAVGELPRERAYLENKVRHSLLFHLATFPRPKPSGAFPDEPAQAQVFEEHLRGARERLLESAEQYFVGWGAPPEPTWEAKHPFAATVRTQVVSSLISAVTGGVAGWVAGYFAHH